MNSTHPQWRVTFGLTFADNQLEFWNGLSWEVVGDVTQLWISHVHADFTQIGWTMDKRQKRFFLAYDSLSILRLVDNSANGIGILNPVVELRPTCILVTTDLYDVEIVIDRERCNQ